MIWEHPNYPPARTHQGTRIEKYIDALFWAVIGITTIGYYNEGSTNHLEVGFSLVVIAVGSLYYSFFISIVSGMVQR
jgi:hypothetical protein